jgi:hypothetical protein
MMPEKTAFLDTNTFLHYKPLCEIDWRGVLDADAVTLFVTPVVIRELNLQKEVGRRKRTRERAATALETLGAMVRHPGQAHIREGVELRFRQTDPLIDFDAQRLNDKLSDDWLVATTLEFLDEFPDSCVVIVTKDIGLQLKAIGHGLTCAELPDQYLLPLEHDPDQNRIQELERELRQYKNRAPSLRLAFVDGSDHFRFSLAKVPRITEAAVSATMSRLRAAHPKAKKADGYSGADLMLGHVGPRDTDRHNERLDRFYVAYEKYLRGLDQFEDAQRRLIRLDIVLLNSGSCPAEDVDVYVHLPDGLLVAEERESLLAPPEEPTAPEGPRSAIEEQLEMMRGITPIAYPDLSLPDMTRFEGPHRNISSPTIRKTRSFEIRFHVRELKHNLQAEFDPLYVLFNSWDTTKSFAIDYRLLAGNVPGPVEADLHVIVDSVEANS